MVRRHGGEDDVVEVASRNPCILQCFFRSAKAEVAGLGARLDVVALFHAGPFADPLIGSVHHFGEVVVLDQVLADDEAGTNDAGA